MDIRLKTSRLLFVCQAGACCTVLLAISASDLGVTIKTALIILVLVQLMRCLSDNKRVCGIQISERHHHITDEDRNRNQQKVIAKLSNQRHIEFVLKACYNVGWIQILYLGSSHMQCIVVILPDSCSADERRYLRQILHGRY